MSLKFCESGAQTAECLAFNEGGTFTPNGKTLAVDGNVTIDQKANLNLTTLDVGNTFLTATSITNNYSNLLFDIAETGASLTLNKINDPAAAISDSPASMPSGLAGGAKLIGNIANSNPELGGKLLGSLNQILTLANTDPKLASAALGQLLGNGGLRSVETTRTVAQSFSNSVFSHLSQMRDIRTAMNNAPVQSRGAFASIGSRGGALANRIWAGGFGAFARQDGEDGYRYDSGGFILGYDRQFGQNITAGFTGAYSSGRVKEDYAKTDVETMNLGLYASYDPQCGFYAEANLGFGYSWNEERQDLIAAEGKYRTYSFQAGGNVGYAFMLPSAFRIIPTVGVQFIHARQKAWSDSLHNFDPAGNSNYVEIPFAVRVNRTFDLGNGMSITPEIRGAWICEAKKDEASVRMGYVGNNESTMLFGTNPGRHRGLVGAGVKARFSRNVDAFIDYNLEFRNKYQNHNVMAGLGVSF